MMHNALVKKVIVTKRDIYYHDTQLFGSQSVVDRVSPFRSLDKRPLVLLTQTLDPLQIVEAVASSAGLRRSDFNVVRHGLSRLSVAPGRTVADSIDPALFLLAGRFSERPQRDSGRPSWSRSRSSMLWPVARRPPSLKQTRRNC